MAKKYSILLPLAAAFLGLLVLNISFGSSQIAPTAWVPALFRSNTDLHAILMVFRLPKAFTCVIAGAGLALAGLLMQTLFRNPLAGPDVLGLSSGASLVVAVVMMAGQTIGGWFLMASSHPWGLAVAATLGSSVVLLWVIALSKIVRDNTSLLLIGLMVSATTSSVVGIIQYMSQASDLQLFLIWSLGNVGGTNWTEIGVLAIALGFGICIFISQIKSLNGRLLGNTYAQSLGINLARSRQWIVLGTSILVGSITAFCGPIAFVGLAVPHFIRLMVPVSDHKRLLPLVLLGGASLLLFCDWLAHVLGSMVLPLNAMTSIIGAPLVIWMILRNKKVML